MVLLVCLLLVFVPSFASALTYGVDNEAATTTGQVFVDGTLVADCTTGTYSKANRNCTGSDGRAYNTFPEGVSNTNVGQTLLVRGGTYNWTTGVTTPTGATNEASRRTIKRYGTEAPVLVGAVTVSPFTTFAGFHMQSHPSTTLRTLQTGNGSGIIVRNNLFNFSTRPTSTNTALNFGCLSNSFIEGNDIIAPRSFDTMGGGCVRSLTVRRNHFRHSGTATGDMIAINGPHSAIGEIMVIEENWFDGMPVGGEEYIDSKIGPINGANGGIIYRKNFFDGAKMLAAKACIREAGDYATSPFFTTWENNVFYRCHQNVDSTRGLALVSDGENSPDGPWPSGHLLTLRYNLIYCDTPNNVDGAIGLSLDNVTFLHNTIVQCNVNISEGNGSGTVSGITWRSNLMYDASWTGDAMPTTGVTCTHSTWFSQDNTPSWFGQCTNQRTDDPGFVDINVSGGIDLNITDAADQTAHDTGVRGALQPPTLTSCLGTTGANTTTLTWSTPYAPINVLTQTNIVVHVGGVPRTTVSHSESGLNTTVTINGVAIQPGQTVAVQLLQGAVENSQCIGGPEVCYNGENVATSSNVTCSTTPGGGGGEDVIAPRFVDIIESFPWACDHYASPQGSGTACTAGNPCTIDQAENGAACGQVVCLLGGVYSGDTQRINVVDRVCSAALPLVIRALADGTARINGQSIRVPSTVNAGSTGIVLAGIDLNDSVEEVSAVHGRSVTLWRMVGWDSGFLETPCCPSIFQTDSVLPGTTETHARGAGSAVDILYDSVVGFGRAARIFEILEAERVSIRNAFARWRCTGSAGTKQITLLRDSVDGIVEDAILTWDRHSTGNCTGADETPATNRAFLGPSFEERYSDDIKNYHFYGNIALLRQTDGQVVPTPLYLGASERALTWSHNVAWIESGALFTTHRAFNFGQATDGNEVASQASPCVAGLVSGACQYVFNNNTAIHNGQTNNMHPDWLQSATEEEQSPRDTTTDVWAADNVGADVCRRFKRGTRTVEPRWPYDMEQRLLSAQAVAGHTAYNVTAQVEAALGAIPEACKVTSTYPDLFALN